MEEDYTVDRFPPRPLAELLPIDWLTLLLFLSIQIAISQDSLWVNHTGGDKERRHRREQLEHNVDSSEPHAR